LASQGLRSVDGGCHLSEELVCYEQLDDTYFNKNDHADNSVP